MKSVALAMLPLVALAGCSSGRGGAATAHSPIPPTAAALSSGSSASPGTGGALPAANGSAVPGSPTAVPVGSSAPTAVPVTKAAGTSSRTKATAPGTYTLDSSGSVSYGTPPQRKDASGTRSLVVSPLSGDRQTFSSGDDRGGSDQTFQVRASGTFLVDLKLTSPTFTKEYRPATPVAYVPDPAKVGTTWSYGGPTTDGKGKISATNKVTGATSLTIGGTRVPCAVLRSHLVLSGDFDYTVDITTWWSPDYRLPVKDHSVGKGSYGGIPFTTDVTEVIRSVRPG